MKALKRAEDAHEPAATPRIASAAPSPRSARREDLWRISALWSVVGLIALAALVYGYTLWRQPSPTVLAPGAAVTPPVMSAPQPPASAAPGEATLAPEEKIAAAAPAAAAVDTARTAPQPAPKPASGASNPDAAPRTLRIETPSEITRIDIAPASDASNNALQRAYRALKAGRTKEARALYLEAQAHDSGVDALIGLAALAADSGNYREASQYYREALTREPNNPTALAGLASLAGSADPQGAQKPLERMAEKTDAASVHSALGGVYASQQKWPAAQQSYFEAYRREPDNPNHAYNLAVSLDQIGERGPALQYYRKALELAARGGALFDAKSIEHRVAELSSPDLSR